MSITKNQRNLFVVLAILAGCLGLLWIVDQMPATPASTDPRVICADNADMFLFSLKKGLLSADQYWKPGVDPKLLFTVTDYHAMSGGPVGKFAYYTFEVNSSTQDGIPIRKRWDIVMEINATNGKGQSCAITDMRDSENFVPTYHPQPSTPVVTNPIPDVQTPTPDSPSSANATTSDDTIKYDPATKNKEQAMDDALGRAALCSHKIVTVRLQTGERSKEKISDETLLVCGRELGDRSRMFGLGITAEQVESIIQEYVDREIKTATEK
jgi:hypothetical protein